MVTGGGVVTLYKVVYFVYFGQVEGRPNLCWVIITHFPPWYYFQWDVLWKRPILDICELVRSYFMSFLKFPIKSIPDVRNSSNHHLTLFFDAIHKVYLIRVTYDLFDIFRPFFKDISGALRLFKIQLLWSSFNGWKGLVSATDLLLIHFMWF